MHTYVLMGLVDVAVADPRTPKQSPACRISVQRRESDSSATPWLSWRLHTQIPFSARPLAFQLLPSSSPARSLHCSHTGLKQSFIYG